MTGPQHFARAAHLLEAVDKGTVNVAVYPGYVALAHAHATLALAAAQAVVFLTDYLELEDTATEWAKALAP